jgi:predicted nucleic acid-binding protein
MAAKHLILCDTNIFINLFKGRANVKAVLDKIGTENIAVSIITYAEIIYGTKKADLSRDGSNFLFDLKLLISL